MRVIHVFQWFRPGFSITEGAVGAGFISWFLDYAWTCWGEMLSRRVAGPELLGTAGGVDRGRVGERLQAARAGLQELHLLRDKQSDMVRWALGLDKEKPVSCTLSNSRDSETNNEEQKLEATLTALKQQLVRKKNLFCCYFGHSGSPTAHPVHSETK